MLPPTFFASDEGRRLKSNVCLEWNSGRDSQRSKKLKKDYSDDVLLLSYSSAATV
jgi:hypothetical protein